MRVNGDVYDVVYLPLTARIRPAPGTRNPRVTPNDARPRLSWKSLKRASSCVQGIAVAGVVTRQFIMRLDFSRKFWYPGSYLSGEQTSVFIALSDRKKRIHQSLVDRMPREALVTREAQENEDTCYVCLSNVQNAILRPCGHTKICSACAYTIIVRSAVVKKKCPLCRGDVAYFARLV